MSELPAPRAIAVTLTEAQWQVVVQILGAAPFNQVAPVISTIVRQVQQQQQAGGPSSCAPT